MLSRTADHLFWMARYMERAENTARMLDVNYQTSLLPQSADRAEQGWRSMLGISELTGAFLQRHGEIDARKVMGFMVRDETQMIAKHLMDHHVIRIAQARRGLRQRIKHPLQIEGRPADDL